MKYSHILLSRIRRYSKKICLIIFFALINSLIYAQTYSTGTPSSQEQYHAIMGGSETGNSQNDPLVVAFITYDLATVSGTTNLSDADFSNFATLSAKSLSVLGIGYAGEASVKLNFTGPKIPANQTTFVRIGDITGTGLGLDAMKFLGNFTNWFSSNTLIAEAYDGNSSTTLLPSSYELVVDGTGNKYIAIKPSAAYTTLKIRIKQAPSLLSLQIGGTISMKVYGAFTYSAGTSLCNAPQFSNLDGDKTGLPSVSLPFDEFIQHPARAVDNNRATYATVQNGVVSLPGSVSEVIYLSRPGTATDEVVATLSKPANLLDLGLLNNINVQAFNGTIPAGASHKISDLLLNLDLLSLFTDNNAHTVTFVPGSSFDRIKFTVSSLTTATAIYTGINVHELQSRQPLTFTGGAYPAAVQHKEYSKGFPDVVEQPETNSCGTTYTFQYVAPSGNGARVTAMQTLPSGLTLAPDGTLSGVTTDPENTYFFDVMATNEYGQQATSPFSVPVDAAPLPVTLTSFTAIKEQQTSLLSWITTSETNSLNFDIERSGNGTLWNKIGNVKAHSESMAALHYSFTDPLPSNGANLYRLKMNDADGTFAYSRIRSLDFSMGSTLKIYPNPVAEKLTFSADDLHHINHIQLFNLNGKIVYEQARTATSMLSGEIDVKELSSGLYIMRVTHKNGTIESHKVVKR